MDVALNAITGTVHLGTPSGDVLGTYQKEYETRFGAQGVKHRVETGRLVFKPVGAAWVYRCTDRDDLREKAFRHLGIQDV